MVIMDVIRDTRGGLKYLHNACAYLEDDEKSVYTGGYGVNPYNLGSTYRQMVSVRQYYEKTSGNPLMHFIISFDETVQTEEAAVMLTQNLAAFFRTRYQVLYCVHAKQHGCSLYHAHIVINAVSFIDGRMYNSNIDEINRYANYVAETVSRRVRWLFGR